MRTSAPPKPCIFIGPTREAIRAMPEEVQDGTGKALFVAQCGGKSAHAKPFKGFRGAGVLEIVEDYDTETYRAVYTVRFAGAVYVLHAFQKKITHGAATPQREMRIIADRLRQAEAHYLRRLGGEGE